MRAFVMGTVNNERTKILLDTGANISAISESFADKQINVQGIGESKVVTTSRVTVKIILGS